MKHKNEKKRKMKESEDDAEKTKNILKFSNWVQIFNTLFQKLSWNFYNFAISTKISTSSKFHLWRKVQNIDVAYNRYHSIAFRTD